MDKTTLFDIANFKSELVINTLNEVASILQEKGYNPINQIVGYIVNDDPAYITNYKNARDMILKLDKSELIAVLLRKVLE